MCLISSLLKSEQVSETLGKDCLFALLRLAESVGFTLAWEAIVLPLHHSRKKHRIKHSRQCIRLFCALQLNLFNCIDFHRHLARSGGKWGSNPKNPVL